MRCLNCSEEIPVGQEQVGGVHMRCEQAYFHDKTEDVVKIRPVQSGPWCVVSPYVLLDMLEDAGDIYEVQRIKLSKAEVNALPEFEGW